MIRRAIIYLISYAVSFLLCTNSICARDYPRRIISLGPSITEELYLLGAGGGLVGCTVYCQRPPEAKMKEKVGTTIDVNLERIVRLRPDIIFATSLTDPRAVKRMRELGMRVVLFPQPKSFDEICDQFLELARIIGKEEKAKEITGKARVKVKFIKEAVKGLKKIRVFVEVGARPLFTVTGDSFINDLIDLAGGINVAGDAKTGLYSREEVVRQDPDVIIIVTMGITGEERETWQKLKSIKAVKTGRIYIIESYKLCSPTPITFAEVLEEMAKILHPGEINWKKG